MIEQGRFINVERCNGIFRLCNMNCIEDEYHFLPVCSVYRDLRQTYSKKYYYTSIHFYVVVNIQIRKYYKTARTLYY